MNSRGAIYWAGFAVVAREALGLKATTTALLTALLVAEGQRVDIDRVRSVWRHGAGPLRPGTVMRAACQLREALREVGFGGAGFGPVIQTWVAERNVRAGGYSLDPAVGARIVAWMEARV